MELNVKIDGDGYVDVVLSQYVPAILAHSDDLEKTQIQQQHNASSHVSRNINEVSGRHRGRAPDHGVLPDFGGLQSVGVLGSGRVATQGQRPQNADEHADPTPRSYHCCALLGFPRQRAVPRTGGNCRGGQSRRRHRCHPLIPASLQTVPLVLISSHRFPGRSTRETMSGGFNCLKVSLDGRRVCPVTGTFPDLSPSAELLTCTLQSQSMNLL